MRRRDVGATIHSAMCGITGIHGNQEPKWIESMNNSQIHRGPDEDGIFRAEDNMLSLASRRLAIIDIAEGHQPMSTEDSRYTIVFNGEIFNAPQLRKELERNGAHFFTDHSDTEVLLRLYQKEGSSMLKRLNGMFAFAIFDREKKKLFCGRDHMGIKPFYYFNDKGRFAFASELKALLQMPFISRQLNYQSLFNYMSLMYVPGEQTIIEGIKRLPAGHSLTYELSTHNIALARWWAPRFSFAKGVSVHEWVERIQSIFSDAVSRWTLSDVPVACSLSGGLDSSSIVGALAKAKASVKTFSIGFTGEGEAHWNELPRAKAVAQKWNTDHHELILNPETLLDDLIEMVWYLDEPYAGGLPSWTVFKFMSKEVKVGLTGTGGDELFGNYGKWRFLELLWGGNFRKNFFERYYYFSDEDKRRTVFAEHAALKNTEDFLYKYYSLVSAETIRDRVAYTDLSTQLPEEFLMMTDRFSMAHSLEARTPFLDRELVELVFSIPSDIRTKRFNLKYLLKKVAAPLLPPELISARKKGFVLPLTLWLRNQLKPLVTRFLSPEYLKKQGIFKPEFYHHYVVPHIEGRADFTNKIWALIMFQLWHLLYIEKKAIDKPTFKWKDIIS